MLQVHVIYTDLPSFYMFFVLAGIISLFVTYNDRNCAYFLWQVHSC